MKWMVIGLALAAVACGDGGIGDALVVVQETNVPDQLREPPCEGFRYHYVVGYTTECDQGDGEVDVCSEQALCQAQLDAIVEPLVSCDQVHGYEIEIPDGC